jgi:hypothetical protein
MHNRFHTPYALPDMAAIGNRSDDVRKWRRQDIQPCYLVTRRP